MATGILNSVVADDLLGGPAKRGSRRTDHFSLAYRGNYYGIQRKNLEQWRKDFEKEILEVRIFINGAQQCA